MTEEFTATPKPDEVPAANGKQSRERSTIQFPYADLEDAIQVVKTLYQNSGDRSDLDQLAAWMGHNAVNSGAFQMKVSAARIFGLVEIERGRIALTPLGRDTLNPSQEKQSLVKAFLNVPLYNQIFERHRGHLLPPNVGLERVIQELGVSSKQTDKARQTFQRSAEYAGFFAHGRDKLVLPAGIRTEKAKTPPIKEDHIESQPLDQASDHGGGEPPALHPFIQGLLQSLPSPGSKWPKQKQDQWLDTARNIFGLIYSADEG